MSARKKQPATKPTAPRVVEAEFLAAATNIAQLPPPIGIEVAFAGRSNVGKSSLMNALIQRRNLVRTSSTPGCTRQIAFFRARTADGVLMTLVDLPGYGYAKRSHAERHQWATLIEDYLTRRPTLSLLVSLFDARRGLEQSELDLLELIRSSAKVARMPVQAIMVATKIDKTSVRERELAVAQARQQVEVPVVAVSTLLPETQTALWRVVRQSLGLAG